MRIVQISASPKQLSKLRNGHNVRITEGTGINLIVHPERFDVISKAFRLSKGINVKLTPTELQANKENIIDGSGLYKALSKVGIKKRDAVNTFKSMGKEALKMGSEAVKMGLATAGVPPQVSGPIIDKLEKKGERAIQKGNTKQFKSVNPKNVKKFARDNALQVLDDELDKLDPSYRMAAEAALDVVQDKPFGSSYESRRTSGYGLYVRGGATNVGSRNLTVVNRDLPPALQSQNNSANFTSGAFLPPQYQKIIYSGSGLYM